MDEIGKKSLELHKQQGGKMETKSKVPLKDKGDLSLAYTPGVAKVCQEIARDPELAKLYTIKKNTVAVITDGSAVLGLGNLGALAALPVMEGKCVLFKKFGGVDAFPICLDTQGTEEIISTIKNIAPAFGGINLEDIAAPRCFEIERRLKAELSIPVMHDDQHGTAVVVLAALINSLKLKKLHKSEAKIVVNGAGAAGTAIVKLIVAEGFKNVIVYDSLGAILKNRKDLPPYKLELANITNHDSFNGNLAEALKGADVFVGVSVKNILTSDMIKSMNPKAVVLALANPDPEIHPDLAKQAGAFVVATGRSDFPNQINNVLAFPGIFRGALDNHVKQITSAMLVKAAENLAACVQTLNPEQILPEAFNPAVAKAVAAAIKNEV